MRKPSLPPCPVCGRNPVIRAGDPRFVPGFYYKCPSDHLKTYPCPTHEEVEKAWRQIRNDHLEHYWKGAEMGFEYAVREGGVVFSEGEKYFKTEAAARRYIKRLEAADDAFDRAHPRRKVVVRVVTSWVALEG